MAQCYSCGAEANPESPRDFCDSCDAEFEAGLQRQQEVVNRADRLEDAKSQGKSDIVAQIMGEIFAESVVK